MNESPPSPSWLDATRNAAARWFDRPGLRPLLQLVGSAYITVARQPCLVTYRDAWIHRYRDGVIVGPTIGGPTPRLSASATRDVFLHTHQIRPGDTVVDLGAGVGGEVGLFSKMVGSEGRVIAVEAHPETFRFLEMHCSLNGLCNVTPIGAAVSDRNGTLRMTSATNHLRNSILSNEEGIDVRAVTLDTLFSECHLDHIDFMKINIEGAELMALQSGEDTLAKTHNLCVSCHDFLADEGKDSRLRTKTEVMALLKSHGFDLHFRESDPRPWIRDQVWASRPDKR